MATRGKPTQSRRGVPSILDDQIRDEVARFLRLGCYFETACDMAGISTDSFFKWVKRGEVEKRRRRQHQAMLDEQAEDDLRRVRRIRKEERERREKVEKKHAETYVSEQVYVDFADSVKKAVAEAEVFALGTIAKAAQGGGLRSRRVTVDKNGNEVVTEQYEPTNWQAAAWRLERRNPERWARVSRVEVSTTATVAGETKTLTLAEAVKLAHDERERRRLGPASIEDGPVIDVTTG